MRPIIKFIIIGLLVVAGTIGLIKHFGNRAPAATESSAESKSPIAQLTSLLENLGGEKDEQMATNPHELINDAELEAAFAKPEDKKNKPAGTEFASAFNDGMAAIQGADMIERADNK